MTKPTMKRETAVAFATESVGVIHFYATRDAVTEFEQFGVLSDDNIEGRYMLIVDKRYDFAEVLAYIRDYGNE